MERTPQEMPLQLTPNPLKNLVFLKEVFQLGVSISSQGTRKLFLSVRIAAFMFFPQSIRTLRFFRLSSFQDCTG